MDYAGASIPEDFGPEALSAEWFIVIDTPERFEFEQELALETASGHPLHGVDVEVVAFRRHKKEIIGWVPSAQSWACVHLTWHAEINPNHPSTTLFDDWPEVLAELAERGRIDKATTTLNGTSAVIVNVRSSTATAWSWLSIISAVRYAGDGWPMIGFLGEVVECFSISQNRPDPPAESSPGCLWCVTMPRS